MKFLKSVAFFVLFFVGLKYMIRFLSPQNDLLDRQIAVVWNKCKETWNNMRSAIKDYMTEHADSNS